MKIYLIAGEASGDLHAAKLIRELKKLHPDAEFRAWGGDLMAAEGAIIVKHYRELAFMGFAEVLRNLPAILGNMRLCKDDILAYKPDLVVFVDYPGFNLRIAPFVKSLAIKTAYYISPQLWAWKEGRVNIIRQHIDLMICILPFEADWYAQRGVKAHYVGHPLLDAMAEHPFDTEFRATHKLDERPILALLPGSRKQEIRLKLPIMLEAASRFPEHQILVAAAPGQEAAFYQEVAAGKAMKTINNKTYDLLRNAQAAMVTSGTATLETALLNCPELVAYKGSAISYAIGRRLVKVKYISLVNLILDKLLVKELIQSECNPSALAQEIDQLLHNQPYRNQLQAGYKALRDKLGGPGASARAASLLSNFLKAL
jgi:lipid-A-disaccharide synthase